MKHLGLIVLILSLSACSTFTERRNKSDTQDTSDSTLGGHSIYLRPSSEPQKTPHKAGDEVLTDNIASPMVEAPVEEPEVIDVTLQRASHIDQQLQESTAQVVPPYKEESEDVVNKKVVDAETALKWLKNGNKRFLKPALRADGQSKKDIQRLVNSENPHAVIFSTSDSRIPPEIVFDEKLGEIYVIRNLGISVDSSVLNSIEYAIGTLGTKLVLVMDRSYPGKEVDFSHADQTVQKLVDQSQLLTGALENQGVKVISAVYNIETGKVHFGK